MNSIPARICRLSNHKDSKEQFDNLTMCQLGVLVEVAFLIDLVILCCILLVPLVQRTPVEWFALQINHREHKDIPIQGHPFEF